MESQFSPFSSRFASDHVRLDFDEARRTVIASLCPRPRPCVTREVIAGFATTIDWIRNVNAAQPDQIRHLILRSDWPGVFSLGGDLEHFVASIHRGDREALETYAIDCVRIGHVFHTGFEGTVSTTAVISGQAMGGGLEGAASCQTIICEEGSVLQLPEIKFGMFPGMGAISYLTRRAPGPQVRRMVETGDAIDLEEAYGVRLIDELTALGEGIDRAHALNARLNAGFHGRMATRYALALAQGPGLDELEAIARAWVDVAFKVERRDHRVMQRLASSQMRLPGGPVAAPAMLELAIG